MTTEQATTDAAPPGSAEMLGRLGVALLQSSRAASAVERILAEVAAAYRMSPVRCFVLPTIVLVEDASSGRGATIHPYVGEDFRLDQAGQVEQLIRTAIRERTPPPDVLSELDRIAAQAPRFGAIVRILGHIVLTVGFGLVLDPVAAAIPVYAALGAIVGLVVVLGSRYGQLRLALPVLVPFALTALVAVFVSPVIGDDPVRVVAPALVTFLPGLALTLAAVELTSRQMVSGASRLVAACGQLALLAFGVFAALTIVAVHPLSGSPDSLGVWAPWVGVALTAAGYTLYSVAPKRSFMWILLALAIAYGAQVIGAHIFGAQLSGFVGAVVVILAVRLLRLVPGAPPEAVMLTCAYWLLVPGALGFIGLGDALEGGRGGLTVLTQTAISIIAIALGMIVGTGLNREGEVLTRRWRR